MIRSALSLVLLFLVAGCAEAPYGASINYNERNPNPIDVTVPANAPSITQQFRPPRESAEDGVTTDAHVGMDVHAPRGTPILAAAPGRVTQTYFDPAYGNTVVIDHGLDENGARVTSRYVHLSQIIARRGDVVSRGQHIGGLGASGVLSGGFLHLHFEIIKRAPGGLSTPFDPHIFWVDGVGRVTCFEPERQIPDLPFRTTYPVQCLAR